MKKIGRPKKEKDTDVLFVGMQMPVDLATNITKDAKKHFRMRTQHILWILSEYIKSQNVNSKTNQPLYTEEELHDMYKQHKEQGGE